jgi:hypothetical protein
VSIVGAQAGTAQGGAAQLEPVAPSENDGDRQAEPLLESLDEIVSEIRILGGAVEASSSVRRDEPGD